MNAVSEVNRPVVSKLFGTGAHFVTGGTVPRLHCGKAHVQSQWEMVNFDPQ